MLVIFLLVHKYLKCLVLEQLPDEISFVPLFSPLAAGCPEIRGLWVLPECLFQAAIHRIHLHALVPGPRVSAHRWVLQLQNGHVERRLCVLRDCQVGLRPAPCPQAGRTARVHAGSAFTVQTLQSAGAVVGCNFTENGRFVRHLSLLILENRTSPVTALLPTRLGLGPWALHLASSVKRLITEFRNRIDTCLLPPTGSTMGGVSRWPLGPTLRGTVYQGVRVSHLLAQPDSRKPPSSPSSRPPHPQPRLHHRTEQGPREKQGGE